MKLSALEKLFVNRKSRSRHTAAALIERLGELPIASGQRLLDVGCGNGTASRSVATAFGLDVTGVDVDPSQIAEATREMPAQARLRWQVADALSLPFEDQTFDLVVASKTLHHIIEWRRAFGECVRVLRPGGYFVVVELTPPRWVAFAATGLLGMRPLPVRELGGLAASMELSLVRRTSSTMTTTFIWKPP